MPLKKLNGFLYLALAIYPVSSTATTFNVCIKPNGERLIFNIPKEAINPDCTTRDNYMDYIYMQDYQNMHSKNLPAKSQVFSDNIDNVSRASDEVKQKIKDLLDADKALDNLIDKTNSRNDSISNFLNRETLMDDLIKELKELKE